MRSTKQACVTNIITVSWNKFTFLSRTLLWKYRENIDTQPTLRRLSNKSIELGTLLFWSETRCNIFLDVREPLNMLGFLVNSIQGKDWNWTTLGLPFVDLFGLDTLRELSHIGRSNCWYWHQDVCKRFFYILCCMFLDFSSECSFRLPNHDSVFQTKTLNITERCRFLCGLFLERWVPLSIGRRLLSHLAHTFHLPL